MPDPVTRPRDGAREWTIPTAKNVRTRQVDMRCLPVSRAPTRLY
jgi:hypothetical protein